MRAYTFSFKDAMHELNYHILLYSYWHIYYSKCIQKIPTVLRFSCSVQNYRFKTPLYPLSDFLLRFFFVIKINQGNIQTKALFYTLTWLNSVDKILLIWWSLFSKSSNAQFLKMVRNLSYHGMKFQNNLTIIKYKFGNENLSHPSLDL